jgi:hypothetical protein
MTVVPAFFAPFLATAGVFHFMSIEEGQAFVSGAVAMFFLGLSLLGEPRFRGEKE